MCAAIVIAESVTAVGFGLTGVETLTPDDASTPQAFSDAWSRADLVVMTADRASLLQKSALEAAMASTHPVLALIPDVRGLSAPPDLVARIRSVLGIEN